MKKSTPPKLRKLPPAKQRRLDRLLDKNSEGEITPSEHAALTKLVAEAEDLMVENAKRLAAFAKDEANGVPKNAVPVTVWVQPQAQHAEP
jgi:hypothetical protein